MFLFTVVPVSANGPLSHIPLPGIYVIRADQPSEAKDLFIKHLLDILKNSGIHLSYWCFYSAYGDDSPKHNIFKICNKGHDKAMYNVTCVCVHEPAGEKVEKLGSAFYSWTSYDSINTKSIDVEKTEPEPKLFRCMSSTNNTISSFKISAFDLEDLLSKVRNSHDPLETYTWHVQRSVVPVIYATHNGALKYSIIVEEM